MDFYIAQGNESRVEDAILLTSEEAFRYHELKVRDTAMLLENINSIKKKGYLSFGTCPKCKRRVSDVEGGNFCQNCGQRLKWGEWHAGIREYTARKERGRMTGQKAIEAVEKGGCE